MKLKILCFTILMLTIAYGAQANLIDLSPGGPIELSDIIGNPDAELAWINANNNDDPDATTYLQKWETDGKEFSLDPGIGIYTGLETGDDIPTMNITWDLNGTGFELYYVLVKDGTGPGGTPKFYNLYETTLDQKVSSGTAQSITINNAKGHITCVIFRLCWDICT